MELALANTILNVLFLLVRSLHADIESFCSNVQYFLQAFSKPFSTTWDHFWMKLQITDICDDDQKLLHQVPCRYSEGEERICTADMNLMMDRLGIEFGLEGINGNTSFDPQDLLSLFEEEEPSLEEIKETFKVFDVNNDGFIDGSDLQRVFCNLGLEEGYGLEECKGMIKAFDGNGDGLVDFHEFVKFMEKCLC